MANADLSLNRARKAFREGRFQDAHAAGLDALERDPQNIEALTLLGEIAWRHDALEPAIDLFQKACAIDPKAAKPSVGLARALASAHRLAPARAAAEHAARLDPRDAESLYRLGFVFGAIGDSARSLAFLERAVALAPRTAHYLFDLGFGRQVAGDLDAAEKAFRRCLDVDPEFERAYAALVEMRMQTPQNNVVPMLERLLARAGEDAPRALGLGHALAKSYEDLGDPGAALDSLKRAKQVRRRQTRYDPAADRALFAAAMRTFPSAATDRSVAPSDAPIFVVGMPRSGTTLTDRILSSHPRVASAGELQIFALLTHQLSGVASPRSLQALALQRAAGMDVGPLGAAYLDEAAATLGPHRRFVDKLPFNFLFAGLIHRAMPNARIVCLRREPIDVCLSNYRTFFGPGSAFHHYAYDLEDIARYYVLFDRLVAHWTATLPKDRFMSLGYEALVADQAAETRRLLAFCGLEWDARCLSFHENAAGVATPSVHQVRGPLFTTSIGRWRRYGDALAPMIDILKSAGLAQDT